MQKITGFLLILAIGLFGLSACAVSEAEKQTVKISPSPSSAPAKIEVKTNPEKKSQTDDNPGELTAEDIKNGSVKADDYDENMKSGKGGKNYCDVKGFAVEYSSLGLDVRREDNSKAELVGQIPFTKVGIIVHIISTNWRGWIKIDRAETMDGEVIFDKEGWLAANLFSTITAGHGTKGVNLYEAGKETKVLAVVPPDEEVKIVSCANDAVRVKYKKFIGWLEAESQADLR